MPALTERDMAVMWDVRAAEEGPWRPLLVGQAPGPETDGWPAFIGDSGDRLARLAGLPDLAGARPAASLIDVCERVNLIKRWPGDAGGGDLFPMDQAREGASEIRRRMASGDMSGRRVVLVGSGVMRAFGWTREWYEWGDASLLGAGFDTGVTVSSIPHPSGQNKHWNDEANRDRGREFLRELFGLVDDDEGQRCLF